MACELAVQATIAELVVAVHALSGEYTNLVIASDMDLVFLSQLTEYWIARKLFQRFGYRKGHSLLRTQTSVGKLTFHALRHSFNSAPANAGVQQETRMLMTGHSSVAVQRDYTHLDLASLRSAVEKLPAVT